MKPLMEGVLHMDSKIPLPADFSSPCYLYSLVKVRDNYVQLKAALPEHFKILYSLKANPHKRIVGALNEIGSEFDVVSRSELETVLGQGVRPEKISFVGPGKTEEEIRMGVEAGIGLFVVESLAQVEMIDRFAGELDRVQDIVLRINPKLYINTSGRKVENRSIQFGIEEAEIPEAFAFLKTKFNVRCRGIHTFVQSQVLDADVIVNNFWLTLEIFNTIKTLHAPDVDTVNFGGGFGIPYCDGEKELDLAKLAEGLKAVGEATRGLRCYVETGRYVVGSAGEYITKVLYTKESYGKSILIVDGGMNNNFSVVGSWQFKRKNYKVELENAGEKPSDRTYTVVGPSAYVLDVLSSDIPLPEVKPGDYLRYANSGSYGLSFSPSAFLGQKVAEEYFV